MTGNPEQIIYPEYIKLELENNRPMYSQLELKAMKRTVENENQAKLKPNELFPGITAGATTTETKYYNISGIVFHECELEANVYAVPSSCKEENFEMLNGATDSLVMEPFSLHLCPPKEIIATYKEFTFQ